MSEWRIPCRSVFGRAFCSLCFFSLFFFRRWFPYLKGTNIILEGSSKGRHPHMCDCPRWFQRESIAAANVKGSLRYIPRHCFCFFWWGGGGGGGGGEGCLREASVDSSHTLKRQGGPVWLSHCEVKPKENYCKFCFVALCIRVNLNWSDSTSSSALFKVISDSLWGQTMPTFR